MDVMFVARKNPRVRGLIDHRLNSIQHLREALKKTHWVGYNPVTKLGYIEPLGTY